MAFGPKDGGKTYTFIGEKFNINAFKKDSKGIALYAITSIFKALNFMKEKNIKYQIGYSLVEIPDENTNDNFNDISLHESFKGFNSLKDVKQTILRHYKEKKYENSHSIFNMSLTQYRMNKKTNQMMKLESKLNFIDFSHTITDNLLKQIDIYPNSQPRELLHKIVKYCPCLDKIVAKALAGKDRTILFYCTPYLTETREEIEVMGKMENILQLFRQIQCNIDINCTESSNSNMVKENIAFLKKKLNRFKETIYIEEDGKKCYQGLTENGEMIDPVDLDIYDDSRENIEPDTDESSVIDSYVDDSNINNIVQDEEFSDEIIIKNEDILVPGENPLPFEDDNATPRAAPTIPEIAPYISVSSHSDTEESSQEEYVIKEPESERMNYYNDVDYLETITEEDSQDVIKAMQGINDQPKTITSTYVPVSTKEIINETESSVEYGDQIVTKKTYCEPVVTEKVIKEPGVKKRIITINTETITVSKRKPLGTNKSVRTTTTTTKSNGFINNPFIKEDNKSEPVVETEIVSQEPSVKKTIITEKTIVNSKPTTHKTINEKPVRTASLKRANITNDMKNASGSPKSIVSSPRTDSIRSSHSSPKFSDEDSSDLETHHRIKSQTQTQTYLLPSLVPRRISSVKPSISPKISSSITKEKEQEKDGKNFIDNIKSKFTRNGKKDEHNEEPSKKTIVTVNEEPNVKKITTTTTTMKNPTVEIKERSINNKNNEESHEDTKIKTLTKAIEAKDAEIKDRMEIIKQYTDTLLTLEENQILNRKNSQKYKKFEKELKQRTEEEGHQNVDELREKLNYLSSLLNEKDKQIKNIDDNVKNKEKELESSQNKLSFLIGVLDEKDAIIKKSNERVKDIENKNQTLNDSVIDYEVRINNLKDQLEEKEKVNEALQLQMAELSDRINQAQERMEKLYQLQIKQKEKHKIQLEKQSLKYKKIIKKLIEKKRLSTSSFPISETSRKDYDMLSNFSKDVPSDLFSLKSDLTDVFSDDDLANIAANQHENKIYAEVLNHYNKIFKKLKEVLVENHNNNNDTQSLMTSPSLSNPEGTENVVRKAEEIVKTEHQHIKSEDNYQMDLVQAAETLNSQVNHWKQYSSDQQRYIEDLQAEQARLMEKIEALSKLQPLKDGDKAENERLIKEANTTLESIKTEIMNSIIVDDTPVEDGKEFSLSDYKEELGLDNNEEIDPNEVQKAKERKVKAKTVTKNKKGKSYNPLKKEKVEKENEQKIQQQNQKINDLRKCCDRQSEMIVNLEFSLMKAQAIIVSLTQNDENAAAKLNNLTSNINSNKTDDSNTTKSSTYKRNKERINPLIYNTNRNIEDSMELDESFSQIQPDLYDVCNLNEIPTTTNPDISTLLNSREFKNHSNTNNDFSELQDQSSSLILENEIIETNISENLKPTNNIPIAEVATTTTTTTTTGSADPRSNQLRPINTNANTTGKYNRDSQVTLINDQTSVNNNVSVTPQTPWKNNIYRQPMTSPSSKYPMNTETIVTTTTSIIPPTQINSPPSPTNNTHHNGSKLIGHGHKSKKNENKDGKKRNPLKNIFSKSSSESMKSDSDKDSLKKKENKRSSFSKFFSRKNKSSSNSSNANGNSSSSNGNSSTDSNINDSSVQSYHNKTTEEKILSTPVQAEQHGEFDSESDDDMPILQLQQKRLTSKGPSPTNATPTLTNPVNNLNIPNPPTPVKKNPGTYSSPYSSPYVTPYQSPYSSPRLKTHSNETSEYFDVNTETPKTKNLQELSDNEPEVIQPLNPVKSADVSQTQSELEKEIQAELEKLHPKTQKYTSIDDEILNEKKKEEFDNIPKGQIVDEGNPLFLNNFSSSKTESDPEILKENINNVYSSLPVQNQPQKTQHSLATETSTSYQPNETLYSPTFNTEVNETLWSPNLTNEVTAINETPKIKETTNQKTFIDDNLKTTYKPKVNESMTTDLTMNETLLNDITAYPVTETFYNKQPHLTETTTSPDGKTTTTTETYKPNANETVKVITTTSYLNESLKNTNPTTVKKTVTSTTSPFNGDSNYTTSTSPNVKKIVTTSSSSSPKSTPTTVKKTITTTTTTTTNKNSNSPKSTSVKTVVTKTSPKLKNSTSSSPSSGPVVKKIIKTITTTTTTTNNTQPKVSEITTIDTQPKVNEVTTTIGSSLKTSSYQPSFKNTSTTYTTSTSPKTTSYQPSFKKTTTTYNSTTPSKVTETKTTTYQPSFKNTSTTSYSPVTTYQTYKTTYTPVGTTPSNNTTTTYKTTYNTIPSTTTYKTNYSPKLTETTTYKTNYSPKITETTTYPLTYKTNYSPKITETVTTSTSTYPQKGNEYITTTYKPTVVKKTSLGQTRITETKYDPNHNNQSTMAKLSYDYLNGNMADVSSTSSSSSFVSTKQSNNLDDVGYYNTYKTTKLDDNDLSIDEHDEIDDDLEDVANTTMKSIEKYEFLKRSNIKRNAKLFHDKGKTEEAQKEMDKLNELNQSLQDLKEKNRIEVLETTKKPVSNEYEYITTTSNNKPIADEYKYVTTTSTINTTKKPTSDEYEYITTTNTANTTKKPVSNEYEYITTTNTTNTTKKPVSDEYEYITTTNTTNTTKKPVSDEYEYVTTTTTTTNEEEINNNKHKKNKKKFRLFSKCTGNKSDDTYAKKNKDKTKKNKKNSSEYLKTTTSTVVDDKTKNKKGKDDEYYYKTEYKNTQEVGNGYFDGPDGIVVDDDDYYIDEYNNKVYKSKNKGKKAADDDYYYTTTTTNKYTDNSDNYVTAASSSDYVKKNKKTSDDDSEYYYVYDTTEENTIYEKNKKKQRGGLLFNYFD